MILQFLLNYFLTEYGDGAFKPLYELLEENSFDIVKALKNAKPENFAPLISKFLSSADNSSTAPVFSEDFENKTLPVASFADVEIVNSLNQYFSN
ncbi:MAG: hypothetical protein IJW43_02855 [Clostridia bacterium]|nr:hypothetical protein [Clostridia bacterium]